MVSNGTLTVKPEVMLPVEVMLFAVLTFSIIKEVIFIIGVAFTYIIGSTPNAYAPVIKFVLAESE